MAFVIPSFPLVCNIWSSTANAGALPRVVTMANLSPGRRVTAQMGVESPATGTHLALPPVMEILLPKGTDIRSIVCAGVLGGDVVELPAGTGRYYVVIGVDDVGKGFSNEYRLATVLAAEAATKVLANVTGTLAVGWPVPIP